MSTEYLIEDMTMRANALTMCVGFLHDGYMMTSQYVSTSLVCFYMRHQRNQSRIIIKIKSSGLIVLKDDNVLKKIERKVLE